MKKAGVEFMVSIYKLDNDFKKFELIIPTEEGVK